MKVIYNNKEVANTTLNYNELFNKPLLNSHELVGNTSLNDIGVYSKPQVDNLIASTRSIKVVSALPTPLVANTMYYVGPDQNNLYHIYLVDSSLTLIDLGMSQDAVYLGGNGIDISSDNEISVVFDNETLMLNSEGELYVRPATENVEGVVSYDNVSIKKNSSGKIYVPTTKSGDRFGVYPFTNAAGNTEIGKAIGFYTSDSDTGWKGELRLDETNHQLVFGDYTTSPSTSKPIVAGETTTSGNRHDVYPYTNRSGYTDVGHAINFYAIDTSTSANTTLVSVTNPNAGQGNVGDLYVNNYSNSSRSGTIVTRGNAAQFSDTTTIFGATEIPRTGGIDLNSQEYTAPGTYYAGSNFTASNIANCPTDGRAFRMFVRNPIGQELNTLGTSSYYQYRIREIITYQGDCWTQQCSSYSTDGTIGYSSWKKVITSDYINQYTPFTFSGRANGNSVADRTYTDTLGRTYTIGFGWAGWRAIALTGTGLSDAIKVHQTGVLSNTSAVSSSIRIYNLSNSGGGFYGASFGRYGTTVVNKSWNGTLVSDGYSEVALLGDSVSYSNLYFDITWLKYGDDLWKFSGTFMADNGSSVVTVTGNVKAASSTVLPSIGFLASGNYWNGTYSYTIYYQNQ